MSGVHAWKHMKSEMTAGILMLLTAGVVLGQAVPDGDNKTTHARMSQTEHLYRGSKIIGSAVRDPRDRRIGEIKDILLDGRRGEIAYAVVSFGGMGSAGEKYHPIPWRALEPSDDGKYYVLHADREVIVQAPGFERGKWPDLADQRWSADVDRYWSRMVGRGSPEGNNRLPPPSPSMNR